MAKAASKKPASKKATTKKSATKKSSPAKSTSKKSEPKKTATKNSATRKSAAKKSTAKKSSGSEGGKVEKVMHEFKEGTLKSSSGDKVKSRKQAIAIGLSEAREAGEKVPKLKKP